MKRPQGSIFSAFWSLGFAIPCLGCWLRPAPDIILNTIDTLRADHLGIYGYGRATSPNIDRWFSEGLVFEQAYAADTNTPPSVISILM